MKQFANAITSFLLDEKIIEIDELEIYRYGTEQILINFMVFVSISIVAAIYNLWIATISMFVGFMPIRMIAGGYHANTIRKCNILTFSVYISNMFAIQKLRDEITYPQFGMLCLITVILIFLFAPVDHRNREIRKEKKEHVKRYSKVIATVLATFSIIMVAVSNEIDIIPLGTMMGAFTASVSLFIGSIKRRRERNEET